jgi:tRNA threonylcarbamoyladenosine biosynthesis protein TsaB
MRILALDAATEACSVALWIEGEELGRSGESGRTSATQLLTMVEESLAEAQVTLSSLDAIVCSIGPGAFTGVRISVAAAQGLAFGAGLPLIPVSTLEALAYQALQTSAVPHAMACLDARMGEVYWGCFATDAAQGVRATTDPTVSAPQDVVPANGGEYVGIGRGFLAYPNLSNLPGLELGEQAKHGLPQARDMARLGALRLPLGVARDPALITPLYLRDKVAQTTAERARSQ